MLVRRLVGHQYEIALFFLQMLEQDDALIHPCIPRLVCEQPPTVGCNRPTYYASHWNYALILGSSASETSPNISLIAVMGMQ